MLRSKPTLVALGRRYAHAAGEKAEEAVVTAAKSAGGSFTEFVKGKFNLVVAGVLGLGVVNFAATEGYRRFYRNSVLNQLEHGLMPSPDPPAVLPRKALQSELQGILRPEKPTRFFCVIAGPPGSGKSSLIKRACREAGGGVGYIDVHPAFEVDFGQDLGAAFGFNYEKHVNFLNIVTQAVVGRKMVDRGSKHPLSTLRQSAEALHDAAVEYRRRKGRPFVLVIDSVERLKGKDDERALTALIEYAKDWAQEGVISVVFVVSDAEVVKKLAGTHPTHSRAGAPVLVGDVSVEEAAQYLRHLDVPAALVPRLVELVGGSLLLVERAAGMVMAGAEYETIKDRLMDLIELEYQNAGLLDGTPQQEAGLAAVQALLRSSGSIEMAEWRRIVNDQGQRDALLGSGVFHSDGRSVAFTSRLAAIYAAERLKDQVGAGADSKRKK